MSINIVKRQSTILVKVFPILLVLIPRPNLPGVHFLIYPAIGFILAYLALIYLKKNIEFSKKFIVFSSFLFIYIIAVSLSSVINSGKYPTSSIIDIFKPVLFLIVLTFGYIVGKTKKVKLIKEGLLNSAYIILTIQLLVGFTQLYGISVFDWLYDSSKSRTLQEIVRITGTVANPNYFAWIVIQMSVIVLLFESKMHKKVIFVSLGFAMVFLSGSRSFLLIFPAVILFIYITSNRKTIFFNLIKLPLYLGFIGFLVLTFYKFLINYGTNFPYAYQLLSIFDTGNLESIHSFEVRKIMWSNAITELNHSGLSGWLFGLGPGSVSTLDNDYLYGISNYGLFFIVGNILMYIAILYIFVRCKDRSLKALGIQYIIFSFIIGYQADTLSGWNYPLLIMFYTGILLALNRIDNGKGNVGGKTKMV